MNHKKHLRTLLQTYLQNCGETIQQKRLLWGYLLGWVPEQEAPQIFKEQGLKFTGKEKQLLYTSYRELRADKQTEHLEDRKLNEKLGELVLEALEHKEEFKNQPKLNSRIDLFLEEILKPEVDYRIMFRVLNLKVKVEETPFWDCVIASYDREQLIAWGFDPSKIQPVGVDYFENRSVIVVSEKGTNIAQVVKRARLKATRRLRVLQNYLKVEFIHDVQLFFELSEEYAVRNEETGKIVGWGLDNQNSPIEYDYPKFLVEHVGEANEDFGRIKQFPPNLRDLVERTLHWIGLSISELDPDLKISFLCTAMETLLTTKADRLKGEKIAYRGYLLGQEVGSDDYYMPQRVLGVYELRSTVVHGSNIGIASGKDYWLMLGFAQATLKNFIQYVGQHNLTKPTKVFTKLLQSEHVNPLLAWLEEAFDDDYSESIMVSLREDLPHELGEFQFGDTERQAYFFNIYKPLLFSLPELQEAFNLVIGNIAHHADSLHARLIFCLGRMAWEDFNEILLLCANGFHSGGYKVLRPMFEHVLYAGHFRLHPEDADKFWDYYSVDRYKLMKQIMKEYPDAFPSEKVDAAKAAYDELGDTFKVAVCEECRPIRCSNCDTENECQRCKRKKDNFTWTRKDIVSMAREQEFDITTIVGIYYFAMQETHPKVISITNRLEEGEHGSITFTDEPKWEKVRNVVYGAHYLIIRVLHNWSRIFDIEGLNERLEYLGTRHREIWQQIRELETQQAAPVSEE